MDDGYALLLRFADVTERTLSLKLRTVMSDSKFRTNAKEASDLFRDNPIDPMAETMYWIEYVARHRGTKVFKSNAVNISWYIYYHFDIIGALFVGVYILRKTMTSIAHILYTYDANNNNIAMDSSKKKYN